MIRGSDISLEACALNLLSLLSSAADSTCVQELLLRRVACEKSDASSTAMGRPLAMSNASATIPASPSAGSIIHVACPGVLVAIRAFPVGLVPAPTPV